MIGAGKVGRNAANSTVTDISSPNYSDTARVITIYAFRRMGCPKGAGLGPSRRFEYCTFGLDAGVYNG